MTTLKDVARAAGVDASTAYRALAGDARVAETTRARVVAAAEDLGYRPHEAARRLRLGATRTVWFVAGGLSNPLEREPVVHAIACLDAAGYDGLLALHRNDPRIEDRLIERLDRGLADGAIVIPGFSDPAEGPWARMIAAQRPLVFLDRHPMRIPAPTVTSDNAGAVRDLIAAGEAAGVTSWAVLPQGGNAVADLRFATACRLLEAGSRPWAVAPSQVEERWQTGIIGVLATGAGQVQGWIRKQGLPPERAVAAVFDNWGDDPHPAGLVLVAEQDFQAMAARAVARILARLAGGPWDPQVERVPLRRILRVGPPGPLRG